MNSDSRKVLIIVENLPVPFDTRVWQEATTLAMNGYTVSVICPKGKGYTQEEEYLQGVHIFQGMTFQQKVRCSGIRRKNTLRH